MKRQMLLCEVQTPAAVTVMYYCEQQRRLFCGLQPGRVIVWDTSILPIKQLASIPDSTTPDPILNAKVTALDYDAAASVLFAACANGFSLWSVKSSSSGYWARKTGQIGGITAKPTSIAWATSS